MALDGARKCRTTDEPSLGTIASRRARHAIHIALKAQPAPTAGHLRVLHAIIWLTVGWSKPTDNVARVVIAKRAGVSERTVSRALKRWVALGVIDWAPARAAGQYGVLGLRETTTCPECKTEPETFSLGTDSCPESQVARETESTGTRDRIDRDPGQLDVPLPRETAGTPREAQRDPARVLTEGLAANGPTPSANEVQAVIARARDRGLDDPALLELVDSGIASGDAHPSDVRKRIDRAAEPPAAPSAAQRATCETCGSPKFMRGTGRMQCACDRARLASDTAAHAGANGSEDWIQGMRDQVCKLGAEVTS